VRIAIGQGVVGDVRTPLFAPELEGKRMRLVHGEQDMKFFPFGGRFAEKSPRVRR
jgi:hypothetical protein